MLSRVSSTLGSGLGTEQQTKQTWPPLSTSHSSKAKTIPQNPTHPMPQAVALLYLCKECMKEDRASELGIHATQLKTITITSRCTGNKQARERIDVS